MEAPLSWGPTPIREVQRGWLRGTTCCVQSTGGLRQQNADEGRIQAVRGANRWCADEDNEQPCKVNNNRDLGSLAKRMQMQILHRRRKTTVTLESLVQSAAHERERQWHEEAKQRLERMRREETVNAKLGFLRDGSRSRLVDSHDVPATIKVVTAPCHRTTPTAVRASTASPPLRAFAAGLAASSTTATVQSGVGCSVAQSDWLSPQASWHRAHTTNPEEEAHKPAGASSRSADPVEVTPHQPPSGRSSATSPALNPSSSCESLTRANRGSASSIQVLDCSAPYCSMASWPGHDNGQQGQRRSGVKVGSQVQLATARSADELAVATELRRFRRKLERETLERELEDSRRGSTHVAFSRGRSFHASTGMPSLAELPQVT